MKEKLKIVKAIKIKIIIFFILSWILSLMLPFNIRHNEQIDYNFYKSLKFVSYENFSLLHKYRNTILKIFSRNSHKNVTEVDNIYMDYQVRFGNQLIVFNKVLFYCEILKCKKIILRRDNNIYIRNMIKDEHFNLTIELAKPGINYDNDSITNYNPNPYFNFLGIKPDNRLSVIRDEMMRNLPDLLINRKDLYIHIRGEDIFTNSLLGSYIQPPYCFYKTVISSNLFNKIQIIAEDKRNPVLNKILKSFPNTSISSRKTVLYFRKIMLRLIYPIYIMLIIL